MNRWLNSLPPAVRLAARLVLWILLLLPRFVWWMAKEMAGQAKTKTKKVVAPWLWPAAAVVAGLLLFGAVGPAGFVELLKLLFVVGAMAYGLKLVIFGFSKPKKKKK